MVQLQLHEARQAEMPITAKGKLYRTSRYDLTEPPKRSARSRESKTGKQMHADVQDLQSPISGEGVADRMEDRRRKPRLDQDGKPLRVSEYLAVKARWHLASDKLVRAARLSEAITCIRMVVGR